MRLARGSHFPALMLLIATVAWATSFSLNKDAGARMNGLAGLPEGALYGPTAFQGVRFAAAGLLWFALIPAARRGWTVSGVKRGLGVGLLLAAGIILQHLALDLTTPAAAAFLTSLAVLWVPILACFINRRAPSPALLLGVVLAAAGLYFMLGGGLSHFGRGEWLGLACSVAFSVHLLVVSAVGKQEGPWRMAGAQFIVTGVICLAGSSLQAGISPLAIIRDATQPAVGWPLMVVLAFPTLLAFGLMNIYQPRVDSTRAIIIYQGEALLAAGFDYLLTNRALTKRELCGALLLLSANLLAELLPRRASEPAEEPAAPLASPLTSPGSGTPGSGTSDSLPPDFVTPAPAQAALPGLRAADTSSHHTPGR